MTFLKNLRAKLLRPIAETTERLLLLGGVKASLAVKCIDHLQSLPDSGFSVYSQYDEDGIIEWLVHHLPGIPTSFVEFGVGDYSEANTAFLLRHRNWRGLVIDRSTVAVRTIMSRPDFWKNELTAICACINKTNINNLIRDNGFGDEIGILSVDIDGNDYWIWKHIDACNPWIVITEYNATFGDKFALTVPYDENFERTKAHHSAIYFGASILAMEKLGEQKGYALLGSNRAGHNAFFVRRDLLPLLDHRIADKRPYPSLFRESRNEQGSLLYTRAAERFGIIADMPIIDLDLGKTARLSDFPKPYSVRWAAIMGCSPQPLEEEH